MTEVKLYFHRLRTHNLKTTKKNNLDTQSRNFKSSTTMLRVMNNPAIWVKITTMIIHQKNYSSINSIWKSTEICSIRFYIRVIYLRWRRTFYLKSSIKTVTKLKTQSLILTLGPFMNSMMKSTEGGFEYRPWNVSISSKLMFSMLSWITKTSKSWN